MGRLVGFSSYFQLTLRRSDVVNDFCMLFPLPLPATVGSRSWFSAAERRKYLVRKYSIYIHATANPLLTFYFDFHNEIGLGALLGHITTIVLTHIRDVLMRTRRNGHSKHLVEADFVCGERFRTQAWLWRDNKT